MGTNFSGFVINQGIEYDGKFFQAMENPFIFQLETRIPVYTILEYFKGNIGLIKHDDDFIVKDKLFFEKLYGLCKTAEKTSAEDLKEGLTLFLHYGQSIILQDLVYPERTKCAFTQIKDFCELIIEWESIYREKYPEIVYKIDILY